MATNIHDNLPLGWGWPYSVGEPWTASPSRVTTGECHTITVYPGAPSIMEQMGTDPISKLATAIEKLADALASRTR